MAACARSDSRCTVTAGAQLLHSRRQGNILVDNPVAVVRLPELRLDRLDLQGSLALVNRIRCKHNGSRLCKHTHTAASTGVSGYQGRDIKGLTSTQLPTGLGLRSAACVADE
jgi:hypothetical protein